MELSKDVLTGLGHLANGSHFTDGNYRKIVNSALGLLAGEKNIERVTNLCPEKAEVVRKSYCALLAFTLEIVRFSTEEEIKIILNKQNLKSDRVDYFLKIFHFNKELIIECLSNCGTSWPQVIDSNWRLDFIVKSSALYHIGEPTYFIIFTTLHEGSIEYIKFTCDIHQLQDLCTKLKEIVCHIEKFSGTELNKSKMIINQEPWNRTDLKCPPRFTVATQLKPADVEKVQSMKLVFNDALSSLSGLKIFRKEATLLSKFLYRYKRAFRQEKGVQNLVKMRQAIVRYEKIDLPRVFLNFVECIPCNITWTTTESYLPTRQMLKWVLLRILAASKLMTRIIEMSEEAGKYLFGRLRLGWSSHYMIFGIAVTGRIMSCAKFVLLSATTWYRRLCKYMNLLIETARFVPSFKFPRKLEDVVGNLDLDPPSRRDNFDTMFELIDLTVEDNKEKKPEQEDDVVITNEVFFRTVVSNEGSQDERQVRVEEIRTNYNHSDEEMVIVFERKKVAQSSPSGSRAITSSTASNSRSSPDPGVPSTSGASIARTCGPGTAPCCLCVDSSYGVSENEATEYDASENEDSASEDHAAEGSEARIVRLDNWPRRKYLLSHVRNGKFRK